MKKKIETLIKEYNLINERDHILIAFSGGPDSVYLALVLLELRQRYQLTLSALHVNHNIEEEAKEQAAYARRICEEHEIHYYEYSADIPALSKEWKMSLELAGRTYRYRVLRKQKEALGCNSIALGHHVNDQAETILYRMARGTGIHGMSGIRPKHEDMIRPLLCITKEEILFDLEQRGQTFNVDVSNEETDYIRNQIRHLVLPQLSSINPKASEHIGELAMKMEEMLLYLKPQIEEAYAACVKNHRMALEQLDQYPLFLQQEVARLALIRECGQEKDLGNIHIQALMELKDLQSGRKIHLPYGIVAVREYDEIVFVNKSEKKDDKAEKKLSFEANEGIIVSEEWKADLCYKFIEKAESISEKIYTKYFSYDRMDNEITLRTAQPGDYFIMNSRGQKKKLNRYFIDEKIPKQLREKIPLLAMGNHVFWIVGKRVSEAFRVTDETERIIEITWIKKEK
ncbi:MAG: tRNA lysidine(34) synthetase TilS [Lachnospiraceae bacterium]|nr:tRNA lysidine(34) synthetase TilS [Lachnospiraceae bacterium]